jgi:hypothetical protein
LTEKRIRRGSFDSVRSLEKAIRAKRQESQAFHLDSGRRSYPGQSPATL